jgi:hypothetical protein
MGEVKSGIRRPLRGSVAAFIQVAPDSEGPMKRLYGAVFDLGQTERSPRKNNWHLNTICSCACQATYPALAESSPKIDNYQELCLAGPDVPGRAM